MKLINEYTDIRNVTHRVEHLKTGKEKDAQEKIVEEVLQALSKHGRRLSS